MEEESGPHPDLPVTPLPRAGEGPGERVQRRPNDALAGAADGGVAIQPQMSTDGHRPWEVLALTPTCRSPLSRARERGSGGDGEYGPTMRSRAWLTGV